MTEPGPSSAPPPLGGPRGSDGPHATDEADEADLARRVGALVLRLHRDRAELARLLATVEHGAAPMPRPDPERGTPTSPDDPKPAVQEETRPESVAAAVPAVEDPSQPISDPVPDLVREIVDDLLWRKVASHLRLTAPPPGPGGPKRYGDRAVLAAIVHVLRTGIAWERLDRRLFGCAGSTAWHRMRSWQLIGVWSSIRELLVCHLPDSHDIDWSRAPIDAPPAMARRKRRRRG